MMNSCAINFNNPAEDILLVQLIRDWQIDQKRPAADEVLQQVETSTGVKWIVFDTEKLTSWDSSLLTFLTKIPGRKRRTAPGGAKPHIFINCRS
jgi:hypothetical protein